MTNDFKMKCIYTTDGLFKLKSLVAHVVFTVVQMYWNKQALYVTALAVHAKFGILIVFSVTLCTPCVDIEWVLALETERSFIVLLIGRNTVGEIFDITKNISS